MVISLQAVAFIPFLGPHVTSGTYVERTARAGDEANGSVKQCFFDVMLIGPMGTK